jgi:hypothetical protein
MEQVLDAFQRIADAILALQRYLIDSNRFIGCETAKRARSIWHHR